MAACMGTWGEAMPGTRCRVVLSPDQHIVFMARQGVDFNMSIVQGDEKGEGMRRCVALTFIFKNPLKKFACMCRNVWTWLCVLGRNRWKGP